MASFVAVADGPMDDPYTWDASGSLGTPDGDDDVYVSGYALTQGTCDGVLSLYDFGSGSLTMYAYGTSFTCPSVLNVPIIVPSGESIDFDFGTPGVNPGCQYSGSGNAIECQSGGTIIDITGNITNSSSGTGVYNAGAVTDCSAYVYNTSSGKGVVQDSSSAWTLLSGPVDNSSSGFGVYIEEGTLTEIGSGLTFTNSSNGYGIYVAGGGTLGNFKGVLYNTGSGYGIYNFTAGTVTAFNGTITNRGSGVAAHNSGTWTAFAGTIYLGSTTGQGIEGDAIPLSGVIAIEAQTDLSVLNILTGKTILGVTGTFDETTRNTDPGIANVRSGTSYKIASATNNRTGTLALSALSPFTASTTAVGPYAVASDGKSIGPFALKE